MTKQFVRDNSTKALINTDKEALAQYKLLKKKISNDQEVMNQINSIRNEISEIKEILKALLDRTQ